MELLTERLRLREFCAADIAAVLAYQNDPRYLQFYPWTHREADEVRNFVEMLIDWQEERPRQRFQFAIVPRDGEELIGNCGVRIRDANTPEGDIGYELAPSHWGHGYATEAAHAVLRFAFEELRLHRVWAFVVSENTASLRVLEKLGMRREGHLRENQWFKGRYWDTLIYAMLEREWQT
jgi:RimJ/RimL family protein N-acetyltransferase